MSGSTPGARKFPTSIMLSGFLSMLPFDSEIRPSVCSVGCWLALFLLLSIATPRAGSVAVAVKDERGQPIKDAVVYALPISASAPSRKGRAEVVQRNKQFVPYVSAVQTGSEVQFPNKDTVKHHIYSFSPAKKFEFALYSGMPPEPVVFDKAGLVTLGCNIHDWMVAYILVVPTPWFSVTDAAGESRLQNLPAGTY